MTRVDAIYNQSRELTTAERQELIERLEHDQEGDDSEIDQAIMQEIYRRIEEFESGAVKGIPAEEVLRQLRARVDKSRQST